MLSEADMVQHIIPITKPVPQDIFVLWKVGEMGSDMQKINHA